MDSSLIRFSCKGGEIVSTNVFFCCIQKFHHADSIAVVAADY